MEAKVKSCTACFQGHPGEPVLWGDTYSEYSDPTEKMNISKYQSCLTSGSKKMQPTLLHFYTHKPTCSFTLEHNFKSQQDYPIDLSILFLLKIIKFAFRFILQTFVNVCVIASEIALSVCTKTIMCLSLWNWRQDSGSLIPL